MILIYENFIIKIVLINHKVHELIYSIFLFFTVIIHIFIYNDESIFNIILHHSLTLLFHLNQLKIIFYIIQHYHLIF